jgi:hypothetical protein
VHHAHERGRVAEAFEHLAPRLTGLPGVVIRAHAELRVSSTKELLEENRSWLELSVGKNSIASKNGPCCSTTG